MSESKKKPTLPKLPATIVQDDWKLAECRWSKKWVDTKTNKPGSAFYYINLGHSDASTMQFETDDGSTMEIGINRVWIPKKEEKETLPSLQFNGGRPVYLKMKEKMPELYVNINREYKGFMFMTKAKFEEYQTKGKVVLTSQIQQMDTSSPN